jgi:hypothetical protein
VKCLIKARIIGVLLLVLTLGMGGCSAIRLAYANGPQLAWWWVDGYLDFSREQAVGVRKAIDRWFDWHRPSQLPEYVALLAQAQAQVMTPVTAGQACGWQDRLREKLDPAFQRGMQEFADIIPGLTEAQFKHLEQRYLKGNDEMRADFLQADTQERLRESIKRTVERAERVYGTLGETQQKVIEAGVAASPFNPELWLAERQRRQQDILQTLRRLVAEKADRELRVAALRTLWLRTERSPDPQYRAYQLRLTEYNCNLVAQVHNSTTPAQRQKARERLKGWEEDLRALLAPPPA